MSDGQLWDFSRGEGGYYSKPSPVLEGMGMEALREMFPDGKANEMNFVLFSTSGVHGSYQTIEDIETRIDTGEELGASDSVTFLVVHPRMVWMRYGNAHPKTIADTEYLKSLRESSRDAVSEIGESYDL